MSSFEGHDVDGWKERCLVKSQNTHIYIPGIMPGPTTVMRARRQKLQKVRIARYFRGIDVGTPSMFLFADVVSAVRPGSSSRYKHARGVFPGASSTIIIIRGGLTADSSYENILHSLVIISNFPRSFRNNIDVSYSNF